MTNKSENVIKNSSEIVQVLKDEKVDQPVMYLTGNIKGKECNIVLLGETHIATKGEERAASRILSCFNYIGCEGVDIEEFIEGKFYFWFMHHVADPIMGNLPFHEKRSNKNKSFIDTASEYYDSKTKKVFLLEKGWKPSIRTRIFCVALPALIIHTIYHLTSSTVEIANESGGLSAMVYLISVALLVLVFEKLPIWKDIIRFILNFVIDYVFDLGPSRNRNMIKNLMTVLNKHKTINEVIVLTGSSHTRPLAKILIKNMNLLKKAFTTQEDIKIEKNNKLKLYG